MPFRDLDLNSFYEGWGDEITRLALLPILKESIRYDRLSSYFTIQSLLSISDGIELIWRRGGRIRLIMGLHDLSHEIVDAHQKAIDSSLENVLVEVKERILEQVGRLEEEISINRIYAFASMLKEGLIDLKIASHPAGPGAAIFHNKRFIFEDINGDLITGSSGMNETVRGLTRNFDDLTLQRSWIDSGSQLNAHLESFERLWAGNRKDIIIRDIGDDFAQDLIRRLSPQAKRFKTTDDPNSLNLQNLVFRSNEYYFQSLPKVALFPHQERVVREALSEWPVRKMLADEVGLGKTLEAGATINFLATRFGANRVLIACPQGLMRQWRDEMWDRFGLEFYIWDSSSSEFEDLRGNRLSSTSGMPLGGGMPERVIISAQLLRTKKYREYLDTLEELGIDVFVLDESHAARVTRDSSGTVRKTKLWNVAEKLASKSTHCLLLTATPMQMSFIELFGQLSLLGLRGAWSDSEFFEESIVALAELNSESSLELCNLVGKLLIDAPRHVESGSRLTEDESIFLGKLADAHDEFDRSLLINQNHLMAHACLLKLHPAHRLVIRNTRDSLIAMGYKFPERQHHAPAIETPLNLIPYFRELESYLRDGYGRVEKAINPETSWSSGFAVSSYYQRLASSLVASRSTLDRRLRRWLHLLAVLKGAATQVNENSFADEDEFLDSENVEEFVLDEEMISKALNRPRQVMQSLQIEIAALTSLISNLDNVSKNIGNLDPKFAAALKIIVENKGRAPILIFSKYTDTLDGFLEYLQEHYFSKNQEGFGYYSGKAVWLDYAGSRLPASKDEVVRSLFGGKVSLLLCSDAASEGLNLQAAATIINIDVPWNPARLEQRIGRIDRLGQKNGIVEIINLWYPNSVEAKIYQRLLSRKEQLELAVGRYPELIAKTIAEAVAQKIDSDQEVAPVSDLELFRNRSQEEALASLWSKKSVDTTQSRAIRQVALEFLESSVDTGSLVSDLTLEEGRPNSFTVLHRQLDEWWKQVGSYRERPNSDLRVLLIEGRLTRFVLGSNGRLFLMPTEILGEIIGFLLGKLEFNQLIEYATQIESDDKPGIQKIIDRVVLENKFPDSVVLGLSQPTIELIRLAREGQSNAD